MDESDDMFYETEDTKNLSQAVNYIRNDRSSVDGSQHSLDSTTVARPLAEVLAVVKLSGSQRLVPGPLPQSSTTALIPKAVRKKITDACVDFVIKDMRSFETVTGDGFVGLTTALLELGLSHGTLPAAELLPHPRTISESIETRASYVRKKIIPELEHCVNDNGAGVTLNFWTDTRNQRNYVGLTVHYFRNEALVNRILITTEYDPDLRKDAASVRKWTMDELALFGISEEMCHTHVIFVTDGNVNLVKAFNIPKRPAMRRLACLDLEHLINSVLTTAFDEDNSPEAIADIRTMIKESRSLVSHIKHTGLFHEMDASLKQQVDILWSPHCDMLSSILQQYETVDELLIRRNEHDHMPGPKEVMEELVDFLKLFQDASDELSRTSKPTLHMVIPIILQLKQHCDQPSPSGCNAMKATKRRVKELMTEKIEFDILHKIACFLCPAFRTMRMFTKAEQQVIIQEVRRRTTICVFGGGIGSSPSTTSDGSATASTSANKRQKLSAFDFSNISEPQTLSSDVDEIKGYQDFRLTDQAFTYQVDPMMFWRDHEYMFPGLSKLARQVLCVPASSTPSEKLFCRSAFVTNDRRSLLKPEKINDIVFLHSNLDESP